MSTRRPSMMPRRSLGYDAIENRKRRRARPVSLQSEDRILTTSGRKRLTSTGRDTARNFTIAAWLVRKHLDYVSQFTFHSRTDVDAFDDQLELLMRRWSRPANCDRSGRFTLPKIIRLAEARRTIDGDMFLVKLADGRLQGLEGDRVQQPPEVKEVDGVRWEEGVKVDAAGLPLAYAFHRRTQTNFEFERNVKASSVLHHAYWDRWDQVRGISPVAAALNGLQDIYEGFDLALARAKVDQIFALALTRDADDSAGTITEDGEGKPTVDFGAGPVVLDLDPGEDAKFLTSSTPSNQFQDFSRLMIMVVCKALDIPYSFFDESHTNFFGSRGAWLHYDRSCEDKRADVQELLRKITVWRTSLWIQDGELTLPAGMTVGDLDFEWVPVGMPWWDPAKEIRGDLQAIGAGLDTPQRICKERGRGDFYDNVDQIKKALEYANNLGVRLNFDAGPPPMEVPANAPPA